ncbi:MAG: pyrroloquinoline quinone biosynthesis protein PqqE [Polyangiaceae bacterium]
MHREDSSCGAVSSAPRPYTLIAELTYRCALRCPYCSNPVEADYASRANELDADRWVRVFAEAEELGVVQLHLTGGEPLVRRDLEELVAGARERDLFTNLITSGVPLSQDRLAALKRAGLDAVQLSVQGVDAESSDRIAGYRCFDQKMQVAAWVRELGLPLTVNIVLHRENIGRVGDAVALGERLGAHRLELANTQYLGWALANRKVLMPTRAEIDGAREIAAAAKRRLEGRMDVLFVMPDYYSDRPRACMDGWGRRFIHMTPQGAVLPCHAAQIIPGLTFECVTERPLGEIWERSGAISAFRGDGWMHEPCRSCPQKHLDFGGCRCQAFLLTGEAAATDPACVLSPQHHVVERARSTGDAMVERRFLYRGPSSAR